MTKETKPVRIEFAPGAFDHFDGTQDELDQLVEHIQNMFANKTAEELKEMSQPLTQESFDDLPDAVKQSLLDDEDNERTLQ
jgi:hypothetical protein